MLVLALLAAACTDDPAVGRDVERLDAGVGPCVDVAPRRLSDGDGPHVRPGLAFNDGVFGVAWSDGGDADGRIVFQALAPDGRRRGAPETLSSIAPAMSPRVAAAGPGAGFGVVWYAGGDGDDDIFFAGVSADGRPHTGEVGVSERAGWSYAASLAYGDDAFAVTWLDTQAGGLQTFVRPLGTDGRALGPALQVTSDTERAARPAIARQGDGFSLVWTRWPDGRDPILLARLSGRGPGLAATPETTVVADDAAASHPALSPLASGALLVAWDDEPTGAIRGRIVDVAGAAEGAPHPVLSLASGARATMPALAGDAATGGPLGLFWSDAGGDDAAGLDLRFQLLDPDGAPLGPALTVSDAPGDDLQAVAAWDGAGFGVAWFLSGDGREDVYYAHVDPDCGD